MCRWEPEAAAAPAYRSLPIAPHRSEGADPRHVVGRASGGEYEGGPAATHGRADAGAKEFGLTLLYLLCCCPLSARETDKPLMFSLYWKYLCLDLSIRQMQQPSCSMSNSP